MEHMFFNLSGSFVDVAKVVFAALGAAETSADESANVLGGEYIALPVLGAVIRLEHNAYDYEDDYQYMISVRQELSSHLQVAPMVIESIGRAVAQLLADNVEVDIFRERATGLESIRPSTQKATTTGLST